MMTQMVKHRIIPCMIIFCILLSGCNNMFGYKVTGVIEEGDLVIWYSPRLSNYYNTHQDFSMSYVDFSGEIRAVYFENNAEFEDALQKRLLTEDAPDLIFAFGDELSPKLLNGDGIADLNIFWDYQDKQDFEPIDNLYESYGNLQRSDILPGIFDMCTLGDKLAFMPCGLNLDSQLTAIPLNAEQESNLKENVTVNQMIADITDQYTNASSDGLFNASLPALWQVFDDFIDYAYRKTRMDEDITYAYFCASFLAANGYTNMPEQYESLLNYVKTIPKAELGSDAHYEYSRMGYYGLLNSLNLGCIENPSEGRNTLMELYQQEKDTTVVFSGEYENAIFANPSDTVIAVMSSFAQHPYKAFTYLQVFLSPGFLLSPDVPALSGNAGLMNMDIVDKIFTAVDLPDDIHDALYNEILTQKFVWPMQDDKVTADLKPLYINSDGTPRTTVLTREEWNAVRKKIELYIGE